MDRRNFIQASSMAALGFALTNCNPFRNVQRISGSTANNRNKEHTIGIIGSGITGLCLAALLSKLKYKVFVFESNPDYFGGHARILKIGQNEFSAGPQYLWNFGKDEIGNRVLSFLDIEKEIPFQLMNKESFENYFINRNEKIQIPMGLDNFKNKMIELCSNEAKEISDFFYYFKHLFEVVRFLHDEGLYIEDYSTMEMKILTTSKITSKSKRIAYKMGKWSLSDLFDYCKISQAIRRILYGNGGIFAENESTVSLALYVAAIGYFHNGAYLPTEGFGSLVNGLVNVIKENGGVLLLNSKITKLDVTDQKVNAVISENGEKYIVDLVISNLSPHLTCNLISKFCYRKIDYEPSNTLTSVFLEIEKNEYIENELRFRNYWWQYGTGEVNYLNPDMLSNPEMIYLGSPSANLQKGLITTTLIIYVPGNFIQSKDYYNLGYEKYIEFKKNVWSQINKQLNSSMFSNLIYKIIGYTLLTPYDLEREINAENGSIYGRRGNFESVSKAIYNATSLKNLYIANATIGNPGVATCFQTASILFSKLTGQVI